MKIRSLFHAAFALLAVVFPIWDFFSLRKRAALINAGQTELRMKLYPKAILQERAIAIAVLGSPEQVGVWSNRLVRQSRADESSMERYFQEFAARNFGLGQGMDIE